MNISLDGKRVLITGASRGLGRQLALRVVACGGHVIGLARSHEQLDSLKAECPSVETVVCDISDWEQTRAAVQALGDIDCLVNNAAVGPHGPILDLTKEDIDTTFNVNVKANLNIIQVVVRGMIARGARGTILNVSSQAAIRPLLDHTGLYGSSKAALDALTRALARELGPHGIRVNSVNPTLFKTEMTRFTWEDPVKLGQIQGKHPLAVGRLCECDDVADAIIFLISDKAAYISGVSLLVDGAVTIC
ncbi:L-xylulose reductase-like [Amphibalanus amphitrite]|uniref:L-xylulose reductase-like n=1 Tax=Amphibalanus amphitrite TaxID=1232801 RepID=UPI001C9032EA|nr:L-xylulose reductase-like [Amphibalanus amphitrite]XP_043231635.1 L-xylulose reductase-like [Amphibalanus amphitrite]